MIRTLLFKHSEHAKLHNRISHELIVQQKEIVRVPLVRNILSFRSVYYFFDYSTVIMRRNIIVDFDGTLTDLEKESAPYAPAFAELFSRKRGIDLTELLQMVSEERERVRMNPLKGWLSGEFVVAPATADAYVLNTATYQEIATRLGISPEERDTLLQECHVHAYAQTLTVFREGAREFLQGIKRIYHPFIVTNSGTESVEKKLAQLDIQIPIVGGAKKFIITPDWQNVPPSTKPSGFVRPVMLRRKHYAEALARAEATSSSIIIGDIYEMDLALPDHLGMELMLLHGPQTGKHELSYFRRHERGTLVSNLEEAADYLKI